jgi:hypothetical protein
MTYSEEFYPPEFDPPDDGPPDAPPPAGVPALSPYERRQEVFAHWLDESEIMHRQLSVVMAERARRIEDLRRVSVAHAVEEAAEEDARVAAFGRSRSKDAGWSIEHRAEAELSTEVAAAFTLSRNAARQLIAESRTLLTDLPLTLDALTAGRIHYDHARVIVATAWEVPAETRAALEAELVPLAATMIVSAFRHRAQRARERLHEETMQERHDKAAQFRNLTLELGNDGMGYLTLHDSNEVLAGIYNRVTSIALPKAAEDPRTLAQRRADVASEILLKGDLCGAETAVAAGAAGSGADGSGEAAETTAVDTTATTAAVGSPVADDPGGTGIDAGIGRDGKRLGHGIQAQVHIEVPVLTLLGTDTAPGLLEGKVPIDPRTARELVGDATGFFRLLTDPVTGSVIAFDDRFRHLPPALRRAVRLVDGTCAAPWCDAPAAETEGHHPVPWAVSHNTSLGNSAQECGHDHRLIHNTRWRMRKLSTGDKEWLSPCGRRYLVPPARRLSPLFVEAINKVEDPEKPDSWDTAPEDGDTMPF